MQWNGTCSFEFYWKIMESETTTWWEFPNAGKAAVEHILQRKKDINPKDQEKDMFLKEQNCESDSQRSKLES